MAFLVWMSFFDSNDLLSQYQHHQKLKALQREKAYFQAEIKKVQKDYHDLTTEQTHLEKFAREKYFMKRDEEDVYVISVE